MPIGIRNSEMIDWNDATLTYLRALWAEGLSTAEIGRRMGASKNAIVGKAHRLGLPARPSPIKRDGASRPPAPNRIAVGASTLPPLSAVPVAHVVFKTPVVRVPVSMAPRVPIASPAPPRIGKQACCWPIGEPGRTSFRFCDDPAVFGKPYCETHCDKAFVRTPNMRADNLARFVAGAA